MRLGLEPEHDPELRGRDPERRQAQDSLPHRRSKRAVPEERALLVDVRRVEVDLEHEVGDLRRLPPPVAGVAGRVGGARDEEVRVRAARRERPQVQQDVRAVLRIRDRPRRDEARAEELVLGDRRSRAARGLDGDVEELVGARDDRLRVRRLGGSADAVVQVHVPVHGLRAGRTQLRREDQVRGGRDDPRPSELVPERDRAVREVDPDRLLRRQGRALAVRASATRERGDNRKRGEDEEKPAHDPAHV